MKQHIQGKLTSTPRICDINMLVITLTSELTSRAVNMHEDLPIRHVKDRIELQQ